MNQPYSSNQKSQNAKFIIVTALVTLVILGIAVWGIVFVANYQNKGKDEVVYTDTTSSTANSDQPASQENSEPEPTEGVSATTEGDNATEVENPESSTGAPAEGSTETPAPTSSSCPPSCKNQTTNNSGTHSGTNGETSSSSTSSVPNTGPEDFLPIAVLFGSFVAFLTSQKLVKRDII